MGYDAVFTWVNGDDPAFLERKRRKQEGWSWEMPERWAKVSGYTGQAEARERSTPSSHLASRFRSQDELRYALRSIALHAPWIDRIFIVTNGQCPPWLDPESDKVRVVDHRTIFVNPTHLPTFNSNAIEMHLRHIPHLSDNFIYFNDDFFLGRAVTPADFIVNGRHRLFVEERRQIPNRMNDRSAIGHSWAFNNHLLDKAGGKRTRRQMFAHSPQIYNKGMLARVYRRWRDEFDRTSGNHFRSPLDVAFRVLYTYAAADGIETVKGIEFDLERLGGDDYIFVKYGDDRAAFDDDICRLEMLRPRFFCINDEATDDATGATMQTVLREFFERTFPTPAPWETDAATTREATPIAAPVFGLDLDMSEVQELGPSTVPSLMIRSDDVNPATTLYATPGNEGEPCRIEIAMDDTESSGAFGLHGWSARARAILPPEGLSAATLIAALGERIAWCLSVTARLRSVWDTPSGHPRSFHVAGIKALEGGDPASARTFLRSALDLGAEPLPVLSRILQADFLLGSDTMPVVEVLASLLVESTAEMRKLVAALARQGRAEEIIQLIATVDLGLVAETTYHAAERLDAMGRLADAVNVIETATARGVASPKLATLLAEQRLRLGAPEAALVPMLTRALAMVESEEERSLVLATRALVRLALGQTMAATADAAALERNGRISDLLAAAIEKQLGHAASDAAIALNAIACRFFPSGIALHMQRAELMRKAGEHAASLAALRDAVAMAPANVAINEARIRACIAYGDDADVAAAVASLARIPNGPDRVCKIAASYRRADDRAACERLLAAVTVAAPLHFNGSIDLADSYLSNGHRFAEAKALLAAVIAADPTGGSGWTWFHYARALFELGEHEAAAGAAREASARGIADVTFQGYLVRIERNGGNAAALHATLRSAGIEV